MPLPHEGTPWPPRALKPVLERFDTWDAWWTGDPDELRSHYQRTATGGAQISRPSQYAGGALGKLARFWWGRPAPENEPEAKLHVPAAADMCRASANLLFSEPVSATSPHAGTTERLAEYLDDGGHAKLLEGGELVAALGGGYLRPMYDERVSDRPWTDVVAPEMALPEWTGGKLLGVNFWRIVRVAGDRHRIVWRHVERHEPGYVVHALYQGTDDQLGRMVPLTETEQTAHLAPLVSEHGAIRTEYKRMTATYVPNMLPNRRFRRDPLLAPMGRSDLDGAEQLFDALDETYSSWMRDVRLAKGRVFAAESVLENDGRGRGAHFNPDREFFAEIPGALATKDAPLTIVQFAIRVEEHKASAREWYSAILRHAGYSMRTVGDAQDGAGNGGGAITAREVAAQERHSMLTRSHKIRYWRPALQEHYAAMLATDHRVFRAPVQFAEFPTMVWPDSVQEDVLSLATTAEMLNRAGAASTRTLVEMVHPEWDETAVDKEVERIEGAEERVIPPFDFARDQGIGRRGDPDDAEDDE